MNKLNKVNKTVYSGANSNNVAPETKEKTKDNASKDASKKDLKQDFAKDAKRRNKQRIASNFASFTLAIQIIITLCLGGLAFAPYLSGFFGVCLFLFIFAGVVITTCVTAGLAWTSEPFRNFWANAWSFMLKVFDGTEKIKDSLQGDIIWISILMFVLSSVGFIYNLIYYIKTKQNKKRFITSCVFLVLSLANMCAALGIYLSK